MAGHAPQDEQVREHVDDVDRLELAIDPDGQALVGELVDDAEHAELPPVVGAVLDEVVGPDMVLVLRPQADAGAVRKPKTSSLGLLGRNLQPLTAPDPLDPLVVHEPARITQQRADLAVAVAPISTRQLDQVSREGLLVTSAPRRLALCRAVLSERPARATL